MTLAIVAAIAAVLFAIVIALVASKREGDLADIVGIVYHALLLPIVALLPAPLYAQAAGFGWAILDVLAGTLPLNGVDRSLARAVRLGAHVPAGIWMVAAGLANGGLIAIVGVPLGMVTAGHALLARRVGMRPLIASAPFVCLWLGLIAWRAATTA